MLFLLVLGEGMKGAFLKECKAANFLFSPGDITKIIRGVCMGVGDGAAKTILTQLIIKGALGCKTLADWWYFFLCRAKA